MPPDRSVTSFKTISRSERSLVVWERHRRWKSVSLTERNEPIGAMKQIRLRIILDKSYEWDARIRHRTRTDRLFGEGVDLRRCFSRTWHIEHRWLDCQGMRSPLGSISSWRNTIVRKWFSPLVRHSTRRSQWMVGRNKWFETTIEWVNREVQAQRSVAVSDRTFSTVHWSMSFDIPSASTAVDSNRLRSNSKWYFHHRFLDFVLLWRSTDDIDRMLRVSMHTVDMFLFVDQHWSCAEHREWTKHVV